MAPRPLVLEFGMGTSIRHRNYTDAACRAVEDAIRHSSLALAEYYGRDVDAMRIEVEVGVANPGAVDRDVVAAVLPYGEVTVDVRPGGLDLAPPGDGATIVMANAVVAVSMAGLEA